MPNDFFVAGGTVPPGSPSYVERAADRELFDALLAGEFCYVLNARQMGKSSLAVRTIERLATRGVRTAFVDLTRIGGATVNPEQWYAGLLVEAGRALGLRSQAAQWIKSHRDLGPAQRFLSFLHEEALALVDAPIVLMIDEIDAIRSLPFSTDELFAGLRQLFNGRATDPRLERLTVCLLGAALPSDLIRDPRTTPFNIGRRVELRDFTPEEARPFAGAVGETRLRRVLRWTNGHPYLTQVLCAALADGASGGVDALVRERYLDPRARETDTNLSDVGRRLIGEGDPDVGDAERADALSAYRRMRLDRTVLDDEANPAAARLKMSGVARSKGGRLQMRNRIYRRAFDRRWVLDHLPHQELRRQRKAFWKGAFRATAVISVIVGLTALLAYLTMYTQRSQESSMSENSLDTDLRWLRGLDDRRREHRVGTIVNRTDALPRGWESAHWGYVGRSRPSEAKLNGPLDGLALRGDGRMAAVPAGSELKLIDLTTFRSVAAIPTDEHLTQARWLGDGRRLLLWTDQGRSVSIIDVSSKRTLRRKRFDSRILVGGLSPDDRWALLWRESGLSRLDLATFAETPLPGRIESAQRVVLSPDGARVVAWDLTPEGQRMRVLDLPTGRTLLARTESVLGDVDPPGGAAFLGHDRLLAGGLDGRVSLYDLESGRTLGSTGVGAEGPIMGIATSPGGRQAVALDGHNQAFLLDLKAGAPRLRRRFEDARFAAFLPGGKGLVTVAGVFRVVRTDDPSPPEHRLRTYVEGRAFADDGLATLALDGRLRSIDLRHLDRAPTLFPIKGEGTPEESGRYFAVPTREGYRIVDRRGRVLGRVPRGYGTLCDFAVGGSGRRVYWGLRRSILLLDLASGRIERRTPLQDELASLHLSPDGRQLLVRSGSGGLRMFDVNSGAPLWGGDAKDDGAAGRVAVGVVRFSPDGRWLGTGGFGRTVLVYDVVTGGRQPGWATLSGRPTCLAWSLKSDRLFVGSSDGTVHSVGQVVYPNAYTPSDPIVNWTDFGAVARHERPVADVVLLPGDRTLASIDQGGTIRLWKTQDRL